MKSPGIAVLAPTISLELLTGDCCMKFADKNKLQSTVYRLWKLHHAPVFICLNAVSEITQESLILLIESPFREWPLQIYGRSIHVHN